jgi:hypothetical protein
MDRGLAPAFHSRRVIAAGPCTPRQAPLECETGETSRLPASKTLRVQVLLLMMGVPS